MSRGYTFIIGIKIKKIFVSYNFKDRSTSYNIKAMSKENSGLVNGTFVFVENDVSGKGNSAIDREIRNTMLNCDIALFLVGDISHNSPWIEREVELATSKGLKIIVMQLPNTYGGAPNSLINRSYPKCDWEESALSDLVK